jgi:hypothetical protein
MPSDRVAAALEEFKAALVEEGMDPDTVDAQTRQILPSEVTLGGNYADLQRLGGASLSSDVPDTVPGVLMPNQPISEPTLTKEPDDRTVEATAALEGMSVNPTSADVSPEDAAESTAANEQLPGGTPSSTDESSELEAMTKAELQDEAETRGVTVTSSMTKAEMIEAIEGGG